MKTKVELRVIERNLEDLKDELIQGHLKIFSLERSY